MDDLGELIERKGKDIDSLGAQIEANSNAMERSIEAHESDVDSATAREKIEERGKNIDAIGDYMDRVIESKGTMEYVGHLINYRLNFCSRIVT